MAFAPERPQVDLAGGEKLGNEVHWIEVSPRYCEAMNRRLRSLWWVGPAMLVVLGVMIYFVFGIEVLEDRKIRAQTIAIAFALVAHSIYLAFAGRTVRKLLPGYRLGASAMGLSYEQSKAQRSPGPLAGRVPWRDVCFDGWILLAGRKQLRVRTRQWGEWIFDAEELRRVVLVHVPRDNLVTPGELQMRMTGGWIWLILVIAVAVMVWLLVATNIIPFNP